MTAADREQAFAVGKARLAKARERRRVQPYGDPGDTTRFYIDGWSCVAELAVARYLGERWCSEILEELQPKPPDVGDAIEVRWTKYVRGHLILHDEDPDERRFCLVTGELPRMTLVGWIQAADGKNERFRSHAAARNIGDYWIPISELRGFDEWFTRPSGPAHRSAGNR